MPSAQRRPSVALKAAFDDKAVQGADHVTAHPGRAAGHQRQRGLR